MNSVQESKNELEAAIRYAENAIVKANQTIESMSTYQEQTGREQALEAEVAELKAEVDKLRKEKEASSAPCGCQAYRDLEEERAMLEKNVKYLRDENERLDRDLTIKTSQAEAWKKEAREPKEGAPTMPVIPKDVAIAIFREGVQSGINDAVAELEGQSINISENDYVGDFSVSFERDIDLDDHLDLDWMRDKVGQYEEGFVTDALKGLCASKEFECRIHGIDDQGDDSKSA